MKIIVLGSTNPVKLEATKQAFGAYYDHFEVKPLSLPSGVNPFPTTDEETLQGAINRAEEAHSALPEADYSVGIESGYMKILDWWIVRTYATVIHNDTIGVGVSAGYEAPPAAIKMIKPDDDSSRLAIDEYFGKKEILKKEGVVGVLTNNRLDRTICSRNALICALTRFVNPSFY